MHIEYRQRYRLLSSLSAKIENKNRKSSFGSQFKKINFASLTYRKEFDTEKEFIACNSIIRNVFGSSNEVINITVDIFKNDFLCTQIQ